MTLKKLCLNHNEKGFTLIELMIVIAIIGILAAIAIPNFIAYRNKAFCSAAESDANAVASEIADYFSIPTHTSISTADLTFAPNENTYTIAATDPNTAITITVRDISGRCPASYQSANPVNAQGDGWDGNGVYQKVLSM
jgi:prepilin-type N-terminal cleavage/methylation domain-containing protein